jgi:hypothetical protein
VLALVAFRAAAESHAVDDRHVLRVGVADIRLHNGLDWPYAVDVTYRLRPVGTWRVAPAAGIEAATGGARFYYVEAQRDCAIDERWFVVPALRLGFFQDGSDLELGRPAVPHCIVLDIACGRPGAPELRSRTSRMPGWRTATLAPRKCPCG